MISEYHPRRYLLTFGTTLAHTNSLVLGSGYHLGKSYTMTAQVMLREIASALITPHFTMKTLPGVTLKDCGVLGRSRKLSRLVGQTITFVNTSCETSL